MENLHVEGGNPQEKMHRNIKTSEEDENVFDLYDHELTVEENFNKSSKRKLICYEVSKSGDIVLMDNEMYDTVLGTGDRFVLNTDGQMGFDRIMVDYDSIFGIRFLKFMQYNSDFFDCQERVLFEALIIKYRKNNFRPFYLSKAKLKDELGIKPDKSTTILKRFVELGILNQKLEKTYDTKNKRPQQVNYFSINCKAVLELVPSIYKESADHIFPNHKDFKKYLAPGMPKSEAPKNRPIKINENPVVIPQQLISKGENVWNDDASSRYSLNTIMR